jgi:hypothetical protein
VEIHQRHGVGIHAEKAHKGIRFYISKTRFVLNLLFALNFEGVSEAVWTFYIGGYQPAQKWLKDRAGRVLGYEDIVHYQKMVVALSETGRIMGAIDGFFGI